MADTPVARARFVDGDFGIGRVLRRSASVLCRYFLPFSAVTAVVNLPVLLLVEGEAIAVDTPAEFAVWLSLVFMLSFVLGSLSQGVILHAAFQDVRGGPVSLSRSLSVGLTRCLPVIGLAIISGVLIGLAGLLLIVPGLVLLTIWFVGVPVCGVERLGLWASLKRSDELTTGHRWKIFGLILLLLVVGAIVSISIEYLLKPIVGVVPTFLVTLTWDGIGGAYYSVASVVAYHDLRAHKEGIDIEPLAAVFD